MSLVRENTDIVGGNGLKASPRGSASCECGSITLDSVSKSFRRASKRKKTYSSLKTLLFSKNKQNSLEPEGHDPDEFSVFSNLSLQINPGDAIGIIGRNGSGKSTLLKLICGIYRADSGSIDIKGRISALIELGAGFHPEFSGRENIYLGGIMLGLSRKEIDALFSQILSFSELEDVIDEPVRTYSSGMFMRLGFSLAIHCSPDILLIDEVLSVGDAAFVGKCEEKIAELKRKKTTMILVSHNLDSVIRWCDRALWLDKGKIRADAEPVRVVDSYLEMVGELESSALDKQNKSTKSEDLVSTSEKNSEDKRWGNGMVEITAVRMLGQNEQENWVFQGDEQVTIEVDYRINKELKDLAFGIGILRADGLVVHGTNTSIEKISVPINGKTSNTYRYRIKRLGLLENTYFLDVAAHSQEGVPYDYHHLMHKFSIKCKEKLHGVYAPECEWLFD